MNRVVGIGNEFRRDDAAGPAAARLAAGEEAFVLDGEPTSLIDLWTDASVCVVVDAVRSGAPPGTIHRFDMDATGPPLHAMSSHGLALEDAVALGRTLGRMPRRLVVVGIEVADTGMGVGLTPEVQAAIAPAAEAVKACLEETDVRE